MTIISDFSQTMRALVYAEPDALSCAKHPSEQSKLYIKHTILNSVRVQYVAHKKLYGNLILACDSSSWRREVFPEYKYKRRDATKTDDSGISWEFLFEVFDETTDDLKKYFPFPVIKVPRAEGDDIIGTLVRHLEKKSLETAEPDLFGNVEPETCLIVSSDRDHVQLHGKYVKQYSAIEKIMVKSKIPIKHALLTKIVKGDSGDGIMNIKMQNNTFVDGIRQKPISQKYLELFFESKNPIDVCLTQEERDNFIRNEMLVSYDKIPTDLQESIILEYNRQVEEKHSKMNLYNYLSNNKMVNLLNNIHDFYN
jgi:hypothetical protein